NLHANDGGTYDGFIARLSADLTQLRQSTFYGGTSVDVILAMTIHPQTGDVFVAGYTASTFLTCAAYHAGLGCLDGAQSAYPGATSGFIARFTMDLTRIRQATYVGGNSQTQLFAIATDPKTGDIVVSGQTRATNLPCTTAGGLCAVAAQNMPAGNADGFV